jgi:hypothetical protein
MNFGDIFVRSIVSPNNPPLIMIKYTTIARAGPLKSLPLHISKEKYTL